MEEKIKSLPYMNESEYPFYVLLWDFNTDTMVKYDVMPYFIREFYRALGTDNLPIMFDDFKQFIKREGMSQFWSRTEYEFIAHGWPVKENELKLDVWNQIEMNIDIVAERLMKNVIKKTEYVEK